MNTADVIAKLDVLERDLDKMTQKVKEFRQVLYESLDDGSDGW